MDSLKELLSKIREKPGLYLGAPTVIGLAHYIHGYMDCKEQANQPDFDDDVRLITGFQKYVENRYKLNTDHGWWQLIRFFSFTEEEAFYQFYRLFDEYEKSNLTEKH